LEAIKSEKTEVEKALKRKNIKSEKMEPIFSNENNMGNSHQNRIFARERVKPTYLKSRQKESNKELNLESSKDTQQQSQSGLKMNENSKNVS